MKNKQQRDNLRIRGGMGAHEAPIIVSEDLCRIEIVYYTSYNRWGGGIRIDYPNTPTPSIVTCII